ncbi:MAG: rRNA maturation RNase YbeY [Clostridia bacterium]|nr:rRNA maturation RNase YbeY [Candidatus Pelethousia sp.]NCB32018.1 rRNA maturation RNase YbeY [Clostridia bacterium]
MIEVCLRITPPEGLDMQAIVMRAAEAALSHEKAGDAWLSATVVDDAEIHALNRDFRSVDRPTDVLSFPMEEGEDIIGVPDGFLGDIVISLPRAEEQAVEYGHSLLRELSFLTVHGALHLLGYDHMRQEDAARMFAKQDEILIEMGVLR